MKAMHRTLAVLSVTALLAVPAAQAAAPDSRQTLLEITVCRDPLSNGYFSFMKWRVGRWVRRSAWPAWGPGPEKVARGMVNVVAGFADDRGALARVAESFPGLDFYRPDTTRTEADCDTFRGDALRHVVTWKGRSDVSALAGQTVRARFFLKQGDLYAFQFRM